MPPSLPGAPIGICTGRGKDPLPDPLAAGVWVLPRQRHGQLHPAGPRGQVLLVLRSDHGQVPDEVDLGHRGQHRHAVLVALTSADEDLICRQIHVLDSKPTALEPYRRSRRASRILSRSRGFGASWDPASQTPDEGTPSCTPTYTVARRRRVMPPSSVVLGRRDYSLCAPN